MEILSIFKHSLMITVFVFVMMLLVDFIDTVSERRMTAIMQGGLWRQYTLASFLGSTPGCLGAFMNVSLYVHGIISFGAIVGGMIATSGDEAFVMLTQFPGTALVLFGLLFFLGIFFALVSDKIIGMIGIVPCESCLEHQCEECVPGDEDSVRAGDIFKPKNMIQNVRSLSFTRFLLLAFIGSFLVLVLLGTLGPTHWNWKRITFIGLSMCSLYIAAVCSEHYLHVHIWDHIVKKHLFRVFLKYLIMPLGSQQEGHFSLWGYDLGTLPDLCHNLCRCHECVFLLQNRTPAAPSLILVPHLSGQLNTVTVIRLSDRKDYIRWLKNCGFIFLKYLLFC